MIWGSEKSRGASERKDDEASEPFDSPVAIHPPRHVVATRSVSFGGVDGRLSCVSFGSIMMN